MNRRYTLVLYVLVAILAALQIFNRSSTFYIVRHAEKLNTESDTPLSPMGFERANTLRDSMRNKGITQIYHSEKLRSAQTAQPAAAALGITPTTYNTDAHIAFMQQLAQLRGQQVLVVSHSNLIGDVVLHLSGSTIGAIGESEFNKLIIVRRFSIGSWVYRKSVTQVTYGAG